jgi:hypothetical protein
MAGFGDTVEAQILNCYFNATNITAPTDSYIKLHVGDPGESGTANAATETTTKSVSWAAASGGSIASDADITWTNIAGSQDATHFSLWKEVGATNYVGSGTITANAYTAGDTYTIASGGLTYALD